jgi:hypothetical protein
MRVRDGTGRGGVCFGRIWGQIRGRGVKGMFVYSYNQMPFHVNEKTPHDVHAPQLDGENEKMGCLFIPYYVNEKMTRVIHVSSAGDEQHEGGGGTYHSHGGRRRQ